MKLNVLNIILWSTVSNSALNIHCILWLYNFDYLQPRTWKMKSIGVITVLKKYSCKEVCIFIAICNIWLHYTAYDAHGCVHLSTLLPNCNCDESWVKSIKCSRINLNISEERGNDAIINRHDSGFLSTFVLSWWMHEFIIAQWWSRRSIHVSHSLQWWALSEILFHSIYFDLPIEYNNAIMKLKRMIYNGLLAMLFDAMHVR